jgi:hypothetical protein
MDRVGGGTGWVEIGGNVIPGEVITLRVGIWDTGEALYDSVVLLDQFRWSSGRVIPGVVPTP